MGIKSIFELSNKKIEIYLGIFGATFDDMDLQNFIVINNQKTKDYIKDELMKLSKEEIIENFIKFLEESGECSNYFYHSQNTNHG